MKVLIITSKVDKGCYDRIIRNWFMDCERMFIDSMNGDLVNEVFYKVSPASECCICIPQCIDPDLDEKLKREIVVDEVNKIVNTLKTEKCMSISPQEVYLLIHSGDLFPLDDDRRLNGPLLHSVFQERERNTLIGIVAEGHMFQFRHDSNDITSSLLKNSSNDVSVLFNKVTQIIAPQE